MLTSQTEKSTTFPGNHMSTMAQHADPCMDFIGREIRIDVDRPMGSRHPEWGFVYPLNYGFVANTLAPDGEEVDAYILGLFEPVAEFTGRCIAVIHRQDDDEFKLIVAPHGRDFSDEQITVLTEFQERHFTTTIVRRKVAG